MIYENSNLAYKSQQVEKYYYVYHVKRSLKETSKPINHQNGYQCIEYITQHMLHVETSFIK